MSIKHYMFGAGSLWGVPLTDGTGAAVTNPVPAKLGDMQDVSLDFSFDIKTLYGENQFPIAQGRAKGKVSGKAKMARIDPLVYSSLYFGQALAVGTQSVYKDTTAGTAIPTTPFTITIDPPGSGVFVKNLGVRNVATGADMTRVTTATNAGEYSVNESTGVYTFTSADNGTGVKVQIDYAYSTTGTGQKLVVQNQPMGYVSTFEAHIYLPYSNKTLTVVVPNAVSTKLSFATKLDDFMIPEFDFEGFESAGGTVMTWFFS